MTHLTPTSLLFFSVSIVLSYVYFWWHIWYYDRCLSVLPSRRQAFKTIITWSFLCVHMLYGTWAIAMTYIKYEVGFSEVPGHGTIPTPFQLWPKHYQDLTAPLFYCLASGLGVHLSTQIEETCYWIHLTRSIRGRTTKSWLSSIWFLVWLFGSVGALCTVFAVAIPYKTDPQQMETNILLTAAIWTIIAALASLYVVFKFPQLIDSVRDQGGSREVLLRLSYHRRLTKYRIYGRMAFSIPFLTISVDGLTPHKDIGTREYLTDLLCIFGFFGLFASSIISILIYFPPMKAFTTSEQQATTPLISLSPTKPHTTRPGDIVHRYPGADEADEAKLKEIEQVRSQLSIVAPFATPPGSPELDRHKSIDIDLGYYGVNSPTGTTGGSGGNGLAYAFATGQGRSRNKSPDRKKGSMGPQQTSPTRQQQQSHGIISRLQDHSPTRANGRNGRDNHHHHKNNSDHGLLDIEGSSSDPVLEKEEYANQYAWSMLADHLRLPENAMGLVNMEMNDGNKRWKETRKNVEQQFFPGVTTQTQREQRARKESGLQEHLYSPYGPPISTAALPPIPGSTTAIVDSSPTVPPARGRQLDINSNAHSTEVRPANNSSPSLPSGSLDNVYGGINEGTSSSGLGRSDTYTGSGSGSGRRKPVPTATTVTKGSMDRGRGVHQPLGIGLSMGDEDSDVGVGQGRSLPPPLRSPPKRDHGFDAGTGAGGGYAV